MRLIYFSAIFASGGVNMLGFRGKTQIGYANSPVSKRRLGIFLLLLVTLITLAIWISAYRSVLAVTVFLTFLFTLQATLRFVACFISKPKSVDLALHEVWPFYTVLVPIFQEAHMVEELMIGLSKIEYPVDRLEIMMICEEVDPFTISMVEKFLRPPFKLIVVPKGKPQTKPRALNYAMLNARGDLITIYDAEDTPHPQQLKNAAQAFREDVKLGALQAPLDYMNSDVNWLTRQFSLEYSALFHVWIPFLVSAKLPFPLGGTSNHIRRLALDDVGGWDSYNVTEDADLSFRLAAKDWGFGYVEFPTEEEAVSDWQSWHYQRVRWMKGYMQTWLVHMSAPFAPGGIEGLKRFFILQFTIGLTLLNGFFHLPILLFIAYILIRQLMDGTALYIPLPFLFSLFFCYFFGIFIGFIGAVRAKKPKLIFSILWMPLYWLALFFPTVHALWELGTRPFFWHKTLHGVRRRATKLGNVNSDHNYDAFG